MVVALISYGPEISPCTYGVIIMILINPNARTLNQQQIQSKD